MVATPVSRVSQPFVINSREYIDLPNGIYSTERDHINSVFFAVVPDAFMTRRSSGRQVNMHKEPAAWANELGRPVVMPKDRWSF